MTDNTDGKTAGDILFQMIKYHAGIGILHGRTEQEKRAI